VLVFWCRHAHRYHCIDFREPSHAHTNQHGDGLQLLKASTSSLGWIAALCVGGVFAIPIGWLWRTDRTGAGDPVAAAASSSPAPPLSAPSAPATTPALFASVGSNSLLIAIAVVLAAAAIVAFRALLRRLQPSAQRFDHDAAVEEQRWTAEQQSLASVIGDELRRKGLAGSGEQ